MPNNKNIIFLNLVSKWENTARKKWIDSETEDDPMGKRLIEHGAICYQNCASELKEVLTSSLLHPLGTKEECQK